MKPLYSLLALLLSACATVAPKPLPTGIFADALFAPPQEPVDASQAMALSPAMEAFLDRSLPGSLRRGDPREALLDALYDKKQLRLEYDSARTRNAAEAFEARAGNCLSLVLMTAAIAKRLGVPVEYRQVSVPSHWSRSKDIAFASEHVNLVLTGFSTMPVGLQGNRASIVVDFLPPEDTQGQRARPISERTLMAMYLNNRAAETLTGAVPSDAYWWARAAIEAAPTFVPAYNTLSVVYLRHQQPQRAEHILRELLTREPANTMAMSNLVLALEAQGRRAEAQLLAAQLAAIEPAPPFHYFDQGMAALKAGDFMSARRLFRQEIRRDAYAHEFRFWLAIAEKNLGDFGAARRELDQAIEHSTSPEFRNIYVAKRDSLRSPLTR